MDMCAGSCTRKLAGGPDAVDTGKEKSIMFSRMFFTRGGIRFAYEEAGAGLPVVLLHGFPFSRHMWSMQAPLARTVRLITPDLRGFGESDGVPSSLEEFAEDVYALVTHLGLSAFVLGGFSMGGYVLFRYMTRHADRVKAVLLLDTRADPDTPEGRQRRYDAIARIEKEGPAGYLDDFLKLVLSPKTLQSRPDLIPDLRDQMGKVRPATLTGALRAMAERPDSSPVLSAIRVPTLIVVGEDDKATPPDNSRRMHAAIAGSQFVLMPEAGHVSNLEQPERFNAALASFLQAQQ
jgi:pimeloyl-ACP methyl ester carboxylesterase